MPGVLGDVPSKEGVSFYNGVDVGAEGIYVNLRAYTSDVNSSAYTEAIGTESVSEKVNITDNSGTEAYKTSEKEGVTYIGQETADKNGAIGVQIKGANQAEAPDTNLPAKFDLRETGTLTPIRDQGGVGSCWTFAAIASVKNNIARNGGYAVDYPQAVSLSESEKAVLLTQDNPEQPIILTASLVGADSPASTRINWSLSGDVESVAFKTTVSQSGETVPVVTALKSGIVTITASSDGDITANASTTLTITTQGVEKITLSPENITLNKGETASLTASLSPQNAVDKSLLYTSDHPEIATVDKNGKITAISGGKATITAKAGTAQATAQVTVKGQVAQNPGNQNSGKQNSGSQNPGNQNAKTGFSNDPVVIIVPFIMAGIALAVLALKKQKY